MPVARWALPTRNSVKDSLRPAAVWPAGLRDLERLDDSDARLHCLYVSLACRLTAGRKACRTGKVPESSSCAQWCSKLLAGPVEWMQPVFCYFRAHELDQAVQVQLRPQGLSRNVVSVLLLGTVRATGWRLRKPQD